VDFIKGRTTINPAALPTMKNEKWRAEDPKKKNGFRVYTASIGPGVDSNMFKSERGLKTTLYIMAPTAHEATSNDSPLQYPTTWVA
jgi:hypothetical protein